MKKSYILPDGEARELDEEFFKNAKPGLPMPRELAERKAPILLDRDVFEYYRGTGKGWQDRLNADLRKNICQAKHALGGG